MGQQNNQNLKTINIISIIIICVIIISLGQFTFNISNLSQQIPDSETKTHIFTIDTQLETPVKLYIDTDWENNSFIRFKFYFIETIDSPVDFIFIGEKAADYDSGHCSNSCLLFFYNFTITEEIIVYSSITERTNYNFWIGQIVNEIFNEETQKTEFEFKNENLIRLRKYEIAFPTEELISWYKEILLILLLLILYFGIIKYLMQYTKKNDIQLLFRNNKLVSTYMISQVYLLIILNTEQIINIENSEYKNIRILFIVVGLILLSIYMILNYIYLLVKTNQLENKTTPQRLQKLAKLNHLDILLLIVCLYFIAYDYFVTYIWFLPLIIGATIVIFAKIIYSRNPAMNNPKHDKISYIINQILFFISLIIISDAIFWGFILLIPGMLVGYGIFSTFKLNQYLESKNYQISVQILIPIAILASILPRMRFVNEVLELYDLEVDLISQFLRYSSWLILSFLIYYDFKINRVENRDERLYTLGNLILNYVITVGIILFATIYNISIIYYLYLISGL